MFAQKFFRNLDIAVRHLVGIQLMRLFVQPRFHKKRAIQRATDGYFALVAAANRADFTVDSGTMTARFTRVADLAFHGGWLGDSIVASELG
jgi:hypothetical protein